MHCDVTPRHLHYHPAVYFVIPAYLYLNCSKVDFLFNIHPAFLLSLLFIHSLLTCSFIPFISFMKFNPPILLTSLCPFLLTPHLLLCRPGRASLHGKSSLRIENVRSDDQGWYECKVLMLEQQYDTFHNGSWVHLTVNGEYHQHALFILFDIDIRLRRWKEWWRNRYVYGYISMLLHRLLHG